MPGGNEFDYIIVGAGSAGCVLANRLSADRDVEVCLVEAGPTDRGFPQKFLIDLPVGIWSMISNPRYNWSYEYETGDALGNRGIPCPRGRVLGGTSAINGMVYIRGNRADFDSWASDEGADGWNYDAVLPYFKKSENWEHGFSPFHSRGGELDVQDQRDPNPVGKIAIDAAEQLQYRRTDDFNGAEQDGFGFWQVTQKRGARASTSRAFLDPARGRPNLTIVTETLAQHVDLDGKRAIGVTVRTPEGLRTLRARREVIVSSGAINSPQLLLLSGIGAGAELKEHGIAVKHELPGVGENLQDHQGIFMHWSSPDSRLYGMSPQAVSWMLPAPFQYFFQRRGAFTTNTCEAGGFIRSLPGLKQPDLQLLFFPQYMNQPQNFIPRGHGFAWHASLLQPKSRGKLALKSARAEDAPRLISNFLSHDDDLNGIVRGFKEIRRIVAAPAMKPYTGQEIDPGPSVKTDDQIAEFVRKNLGTTYHPAGTCKMGKDKMAVVDPQLRVHGLTGLRVVDASVMPRVTSGNTNAPTIMIAERGADFIKQAWAN